MEWKGRAKQGQKTKGEKKKFGERGEGGLCRVFPHPDDHYTYMMGEEGGHRTPDSPAGLWSTYLGQLLDDCLIINRPL